MTTEEEHALHFRGVWIPDFILTRVEHGSITTLSALIWALIATWKPSGWEYRTDDDAVRWVADKLGLGAEEVRGHIEYMFDEGVIQ